MRMAAAATLFFRYLLIFLLHDAKKQTNKQRKTYNRHLKEKKNNTIRRKQDAWLMLNENGRQERERDLII
jgi:hypothetical protein